MPGSGAEKRAQADAVRAYKYAQQGMTHKEIAELIGKQVHQVKAAIQRGERLVSLNPSGEG